MKVELLVSRSGPGGADNAGDQITVEADEAQRMIEAGQAIPVRAQKAPEKATKRAKAEKASK